MSFSQAWGSSPLSLAVASRLWMMAARCPARSEPTKSQFFFPSDRADGVLRRVVVDGQGAVGEVALQRRPAFEAVVDGPRQAAAVGRPSGVALR